MKLRYKYPFILCIVLGTACGNNTESDPFILQVVFDVKNYTHNSKDAYPDGVTHFNPMKLYTSKEIVNYSKSKGKTLDIYWDDLKIWNN